MRKIVLFFYILLQVENECGEIPMVIVQNKIDLMDQAVVTP